jgi:uncharacterized protein YdiU (UPF0061 family)
MKKMNLTIKNTFTESLPADPILENTRRQVTKACYSFVTPKQTAKPEILHVSKEMAANLGVNETDFTSEEFKNVFTGNTVLANTKPYAMCYGGHQFGQWAGQLGDGRAINLAEVEHQDKSWVIQLKGAGETPYSRTADGLAVLRSSVREYLCSEAMFHLGVPTTRALSIGLTGDEVLRDMMYNGNSAYEKGAVVTRVAPSFLRFGSYEILAARGDHETLKTLVDYTVQNLFSHLGNPSKTTYINFFKEVSERSLEMVIHWQRVGFVHGVMNTDNLSILGLTIDYGPYGWLEGYDFGWTPNTTDSQQKRYRYGSQPDVVLWNLYQLANALYPLVGEAEGFETVLSEYRDNYTIAYLDMMRSKLGLKLKEEGDAELIKELELRLHLTETDMTIFFRNLSDLKKGSLSEGIEVVNDAFYILTEVSDTIRQQWNDWFLDYNSRLKRELLSDSERKEQMNAVNPKYVLRNYMSQLAIDAADDGDYSIIDELYELLKHPYTEQKEQNKWFVKRPEWARHKVGCSMLSCSS